ncbi:FimV/HubP family polar landmark protein, partial [Pseudoalteromonas phenolica]|uniref:FimV/HubP family polar landmark protein n=1 Tax=Pseudoalteromonas phenolica TaxID=161398 RepID=UPI001282404C
DFPEFDEEAALEAATEEQALEVQDSPAQEETVQEETAPSIEEDLLAESIENELEIEEFPEFDEGDALEAVTEEQALEIQDTPVQEEAVLREDSELPSDQTSIDDRIEDEFEGDILTDIEEISPDAFLNELDDLASNEEAESHVEQNIDETAIEDQFMSEISDTDFDALLNDLAEPEPIDTESLDEVELNFDTLLNEELNKDLGTLDVAIESDDEVSQPDVEEYLEIDDLLAESDDFEAEEEPYQEANMDVGLGDFDDLLAGENAPDVDLEADGFSAKLDLARAYIEIDDSESALAIIEEVINAGPESVQAEASSLRDKIQS